MKLAILPALLAASCLGAADNSAPPPGVLSVMGRFGIAHACAIGPNVAVTAAHVADHFPTSPTPPEILRFSHGSQEGVIVPLRLAPLPGADAWMYRTLDGQAFTGWLSVASGPPAPGSFVTWWDHDWSSRDRAFSQRKRRERVLRIVAGNIITRGEPEGGASGGCVLDESGAVVGIVTWGLGTDGGRIGVMVGLWGEWIPAESSSK